MKKFLAASALLLTLCMFTGCAAEQSSQQSPSHARTTLSARIGVQINHRHDYAAWRARP
ncbi:MAG: hypothetical protein ACLSG5_01860 [Oscillospiraceae bacterium]